MGNMALPKRDGQIQPNPDVQKPEGFSVKVSRAKP